MECLIARSNILYFIGLPLDLGISDTNLHVGVCRLGDSNPNFETSSGANIQMRINQSINRHVSNNNKTSYCSVSSIIIVDDWWRVLRPLIPGTAKDDLYWFVCIRSHSFFRHNYSHRY